MLAHLSGKSGYFNSKWNIVRHRYIADDAQAREIIKKTIQERSEIHFTEDELDEIYRYISHP
jgi:hypothetical protein